MTPFDTKRSRTSEKVAAALVEFETVAA